MPCGLFLLGLSMIQWFSKITSDEYNSLLQWLLKQDGLFLKIIIIAQCRASRKTNTMTGLNECEFYLSQTETDVFGLHKTQQGKLRRALEKLILKKIFKKIDSKTGNKNSSVYAFNKGFMDFIDFVVDSETDNKQITDRQQIDNRQTQKENVLECKNILEQRKKYNKKESNDFFETVWNLYPSKTGKKEAIRHFNASVKSDKDRQDIRIALKNYLESDRVNNGYVLNGSTWFNNWRDWINYTEKERKVRDGRQGNALRANARDSQKYNRPPTGEI